MEVEFGQHEEIQRLWKARCNVRLPRKTGPLSLHLPRRADYGFYSVLGLLVLATVGFVGLMLKGPARFEDCCVSTTAI